MGLGLLGRGVGDAEFMAKLGADLIITDLKSAEELKPSLERLKRFPTITVHVGGHQLEDFRDRDFILKAAGVPLDSLFIAEARRKGIPIEMDASLFSKLAPPITVIGVTGTRGKSTTAALIYEILKDAGKRVFLGGNIKDVATLPLLEKVLEGDFVVLELDSWQLQGFGESMISPHIAVFTTFLPDHMNYYNGDMQTYFSDKANIFKFQKPGDHLVVGEDIADKFDWSDAGEVLVAHRAGVPRDHMVHLPGGHNRLNAACAIAVAKLLGIRTVKGTRAAFNRFAGLAGRLELKRMVNGVTYYNDSNATTPDATIAGLRAIGDSHKKKIVLIMGGSDKGLNMSALIDEIPNYCKQVLLLPGSGTTKIKDGLPDAIPAVDLKDAVLKAKGLVVEGDIVLFSPAFASFGLFKNEYDRGEQFNKILTEL